MPKRTSTEDTLIAFCTTAPLPEVERLLSTARTIVKARTPKTATKATKKKSTKREPADPEMPPMGL